MPDSGVEKKLAFPPENTAPREIAAAKRLLAQFNGDFVQAIADAQSSISMSRSTSTSPDAGEFHRLVLEELRRMQSAAQALKQPGQE